MRKRFISIALSLAMLLTMMPAAAFAGAEGDSEATDIPEAVGLASVLGQTPEVQDAVYRVSDDVTIYSISADVIVYPLEESVSSSDLITADSEATVRFYGKDKTFTDTTTGAVTLKPGAGTTVYAKVVSADESCEARYALTVKAAAYATTQQTDSVIKVTAAGGPDRYYPAVNAAIVAEINALTAPVITLLKDYDYTVPYTATRTNGTTYAAAYVTFTTSLTLDLNGKTLTLINGYLRMQGSSTTVQGGTVIVSNTSEATLGYGIYIPSGNPCTVKDCTIIARDNTASHSNNYVQRALYIAGSGGMNVEEALLDNVTVTNEYAYAGWSSLRLQAQHFTVDGGSFTGYSAAYFSSYSTAEASEVTGAAFTATNSSGCAMETYSGAGASLILQGESVFNGNVKNSNSTGIPVILSNVYISGDLIGPGLFDTERTGQENVTMGGIAYTYYTELPGHTATAVLAGASEGASVSPAGTKTVYETKSGVYTVTLEEDYRLVSAIYQEAGGDPVDITSAVTWDDLGLTGSYTVERNPAKDYTITFTVAEDFGDEVVASIGAVEYQSLSGALNAMQPGDTLKLLRDVTRETALVFQKTAVLDLNGRTLTMNCANTNAIEVSGAALTVKDDSAGANGRIDCAFDGVTLKGTGAELILDSGAIYVKLMGVCVQAGAGQQVTVNGGRLTAVDRAAISTNGTAKVTINGGIVENTGAEAYGVIYLAQMASLDMSGGSVLTTSMRDGCIVSAQQAGSGAYGKISISGGTVTSENSPALYIFQSGSGSADISGGTLTAENSPAIVAIPTSTSTYQINISGGAKLDAADYVFETNRELTNLTGFPGAVISGGAFKYGEIPWSDSEYVSFTNDAGGKARVLNISADSEGDYAGWYRPVTTESLNWTDANGNPKTYQDFEDLNAMITTAAITYGDGTGDGFSQDLWSAFKNAYEMAVKVSGYMISNGTVSNANSVKSANQVEIDYREAALAAALTALEQGMTQEEFDNLPNGTYSIEVDMYRADFSGLSMANGAIGHTAVLTLQDGAGTLEMKFQPMPNIGLMGHLEKIWIFQGNTPEQAQANSYSNAQSVEAVYSDYYYDTMNASDGMTPEDYAAAYAAGNTAYEPFLPGTVTFTLPYLITTGNGNCIYARVSVDAMNSISIGAGEQNVIVYLKYSTLEPLETEDTLFLSTDNVSLIAGSSIAGSQTVTAKIKSYDSRDYSLSWTSDMPSVAAAASGVITAVSAGTCTVTATASKAGADDLVKTVAVTVAAGTATPVRVENVTTGGGTSSATLSGDTLVTAGQDENNVDVGSGAIAVDARSGESGITAATVQIPADVVNALSSGRSVAIQTDVGNVTLDAGALSQINGTGRAVTLTVSEADAPASGLGTFTAAYTLTLTDANGTGILFGSGTATVSVPCGDANVRYAYHIQDGKRTERRPVTLSGGMAGWTTPHFSTWALSANEYSVGGGTPNPSPDPPSNPGTGFFLDDGNYYVDIDLWKAAADEASMGNAAFKNNSKALVTVNNGKITTVQVATNPVDVDQYHSAITSFKVEGKSVNVLEVGDLTTQPAGKKYDYVKRISFTMPASGQPDIRDAVTYVNVQFKVPDTPMDAAVGATLEARLRFTWRSARATTDTELAVDDTTAKGKSSLTGEEIEDVKLTDKATGIRLTTDTERVGDDAKLSVTQITSGKEFTAAEKAMKGIADSWSLYKIIVTEGGKEAAPQGAVTLSFPCGSDGLTVYRVSEGGTRTVLKGEVKNGYYVLNTSSLGLFAIVGELAEPPAETADSFTDVPEGHWAAAYIAAAVEKGLFNGVTDTTFDPEGQMTRAMLFTVLHRMSGKAGEAAGGTWYSAAMEWARSEGISDGSDPNRSITREELAAMIYRYAGSPAVTGELTAFGDAGTVSAWAADAMGWAVEQGVITGKDGNLLDPAGPATRAQVAVMLVRYLDKN